MSAPAAGVGIEAPPVATGAAAPRLTRLQLHGFKSFAARTAFAFEPGITAVVGPNGSGKSNVADAVRWVLGEQSHGALRSKRTEDVIFAGGQGRAPAGMAEVAVTFDNADRWLPIDFAEVTVTRRAYRGGEGHYLINGRRVRLKDVAHLTASLGQSHLVVGQGLVDAALSQRADERRGLFEHAADLTGLRLKAAEAERSLAETETNSARLADLLAELEPRLKTLERAARQAREWRGVHERLRELQRDHYGRLLAAAHAAVAAAVAAEAAGDAAVAAGRDALAAVLAAEADARVAVDAARAALAQHEVRRRSADDAARRVDHERELAAERHAALGRRRGDMADTQAALDEQVAAVAGDLARLAPDLAALEDEVAVSRAAVADLVAAGAEARRTRAGLDRRAADLAKTVAEYERGVADLGRRRDLLAQRRETDAAERARVAAAAAERADRLAALGVEVAAADATARADDAARDAFAARAVDLAAAAERAAAAATTAQEAVAAAEGRLGQATTRREVLHRLHESGAGFHAGVRETLAAARAGRLAGVRGVVAELLEVPAAYDTAVEVALGGHVQDIVVERWADAEAAIAHLKRGGSGRATFQPIDTVRPRGARALPPEAAARGGDRLHGVASDLVGAAPELRGVVEALLGRTAIVDDLPTARVVLPGLPAGWSAVTLGGDIARAGGSVTGGAAVRESGVLGRERELRELPATIRRLEAERTATVTVHETAAATARTVTADRQAAESARAAHLAAAAARRDGRARLATWLDQLQCEHAAAARRAADLAAAAAAADRDLAALAAAATDQAAAAAASRDDLTAARADLDRAAAAAAGTDRDLAAEGRRLAALDERLRGERRREAGLRAQERALAEELAVRGERAAALDGERAALAAQHERLTRETAALAAAVAATVAERPPLEAAARAADATAARLARAVDAARAALLDHERARGAANLGAERTRGELATIRQRITDDLELDEPDELLRVSEGAEFLRGRSYEGGDFSEEVAGTEFRRTDDGVDPSSSSVTPVPPSETPPPQKPVNPEREIATLKERLRRVGYVGEDAVAEHEREAARQAFLRAQLADVQGAAASLRVLLADLHGTMRGRFDETFAKVAAAFAETFTTLFGGGSARLILTGGVGAGDGEDGADAAGAPGVDIIAQPPGKRLQSLALLSGGERALTAAALLVAILRVNPAPFCLLDEVDAALDEANVVRFREQLRTLAAETQVVVITHNRGTIEIADTLYGVSMGDDGVSQVLSLRLTE